MINEELDQLATPAEACREFARNYGMDNPNQAWVLTDFDTWEANPYYNGPAVPHPESAEAEFGLPYPPPAPVVAPVVVSCENEDVPF